MSAARFCLVMPFRNEARNLPHVLASIASQQMDPSRIRLVAVDNGSSDDGAEIIERWSATSGIAAVTMRLDRPSIPAALNAAIALAANDEIVARVDGHTVYGQTYLSDIAEAFDRLPEDVWCVGGSQSTLGVRDSFGDALIAALMTNAMGLGGAAFRSARASREVDSAYLGAWRPGVLARLNGFDERWRANEDAEFAARIQRAGGRIWFVPLPCEYHITRGPLATLAQWNRYGFWRARTSLRHRHTVKLRHIAPVVTLVLGAALLLSPWRVLLVPLMALFALLVVLQRANGERPLVTATAVLYFPLVHAAFALGLVAGCLTAATAAFSSGSPARAAR